MYGNNYYYNPYYQQQAYRTQPNFNALMRGLDYFYGGGSSSGMAAGSSAGANASAASTAGGAAGSAGAGTSMSGLMAGGLWMLPVAAGIGLGLQAKAEGNSYEDILGPKGYGGTPMRGLQSLYEGDFQDVAEKLGGGGPVSGLISLIGGENTEDNLKATFGAPYLAYENIAKKGGGSAMDWINVFANPFTY